eukprot:TRINITY_DN764_c0_g1_i12.p1 TRINITY_DN764_c0_g1~~TRINITY_DN764_c0_g1_i12.p1  ORF type:complete len:187 (-),score=33.71 TRINITY_DN764_c0_g1_i12:422-982(-)
MIEHTGRLLDEDQQLQIQVTDPDCRICRGAGSSKTPLYLPCDCQGDGNGVHLDCLSTWIQCRPAAQEAMTCEVCGAKYNLDYRRRVVFKRDQCCSTGSWRQYRDLGIMLLVFGVLAYSFRMVLGDGDSRDFTAGLLLAMYFVSAAMMFGALVKITLRWIEINSIQVLNVSSNVTKLPCSPSPPATP